MDTVAIQLQKCKNGLTACDKIPGALRKQPGRVLWKNGTVKANGKREKVPYGPISLKRASSTNPETWGTFEEVLSAYSQGEFDGIGFVFNGSLLVAIDIDNCRNPVTGKIAPWALAM